MKKNVKLHHPFFSPCFLTLAFVLHDFPYWNCWQNSLDYVLQCLLLTPPPPSSKEVKQFQLAFKS